jgi:hypothetical protein
MPARSNVLDHRGDIVNANTNDERLDVHEP